MSLSPATSVLARPAESRIQIPTSASVTILVDLEAHLSGNRTKLAASVDPDRELYLARLDDHLSALRDELDRRWVARAEGVSNA